MRLSWVVFLSLPLLAAAQQPSQQRPPSPDSESGASPMPEERAADSYAIYSMLVSAPELQHLSPGQSHTWAVADTTVSTEDRSPAVSPQGQLKPPPGKKKVFDEAVEDFESNQHFRVHLTRSGFQRGVTLLTPDQVQQLREAKTSPAVDSSTQTQWSSYAGVTFFSEVYFDKKHTAALVYQSEWCAHLCSAGTWVYLEKQGGRWVRQSGNVVPGT